MTTPIQPSAAPTQLSDYLRVFRKRRMVILLSVLIGGLGGWILTGFFGSTYESTASILVRPVGIDLEDSSLRPDQLVSMGTERELIRSGAVVARVAAEIDVSPQTALDNVAVSVAEDTQVINIKYFATTPETAQTGAQTFAVVYLDERATAAEDAVARRVSDISDQIEQAREELAQVTLTLSRSPEGSNAYTQALADRELLTSRISDLQRDLSSARTLNTNPGLIITEATVPTSPSGTSAKVNIVVGMMVGALIGLPLAFFADRIDDRVFEPEDLASYPLPRTLGSVTRDSSQKFSSKVLNGARHSAGSETYRRLALSLMTRLEAADSTTVAIVATDDERTTDIAARLAISLSDLEKKVVLVGANPADPISDHLPLNNSPGLSELVKGAAPNEVFQFLPELPNLLVITEGADWGTDLPWHSVQPYIDGQRIKHDFLLLNPASPSERAEALRMATTARNVVLVIEKKHTTMSEVQRSMQDLTAGGANVLGFIFVEGVVKPAPIASPSS